MDKAARSAAPASRKQRHFGPNDDNARLTAKLFKAMRVSPLVARATATNRLGGWTANLVRASRIQLVIAVSDVARLPIVIDAAPSARIAENLAGRLLETLLWSAFP